MNPQAALTLRGNGILRQLQSDVLVTTPFTGQSVTQSNSFKSQSFKGIWDTGASGSVITLNVVNALGIKPTGQTTVHTAKGPHITNTYLVNMVLPSNVGIQNLNVTEGDLSPGADILIGMDIITLGDFIITNQGVTVMSFRTPSCSQVDYVQSISKRNRLKMRHGPKKRR